MVSSNVAVYTKKQLAGAALFTGYYVRNIIGPQTFKSSEAPRYHSAHIVMLAGYCVKLAMTVIFYIYAYPVNKRRDRKIARGQGLSEEEKESIELGVHDVTKIDNKGFRYII